MSILTSKECLAALGEPLPEREGKIGMVLWNVPTHLWIPVLPKRIYLNTRIVKPLSTALANVRDRGLTGDIKTWDGCFNVRKKRGGSTPSLHSWGLAIDINSAWNQLGKVPIMSAHLVKCFTDAGFDWGGVWSRPDGMHFQLKKELFK